MNPKNSDKDENERKGVDQPGNKDSQRDGDYGGSDYGRAENVNEDWQAGATEYDVNYRSQGFSSSGQSEKDSFEASREVERDRNRGRTDSMGVEETAPRNVPNSDELIHEEVHMILEHQPEIDTSDIDVSVRNGVVILEGSVREPLDMRHVDEAIQMVAGVQNLENRVRILQDGHPVEGIEYGSNERGKSGISDQRSGENPSDYQGQGTGRAKGQNT